MMTKESNSAIGPRIHNHGVIHLVHWNPAYVEVDEYDDPAATTASSVHAKKYGLTISSFHNVFHTPPQRDMVARIRNIDTLSTMENFQPERDLEILTDVISSASEQPRTTWPNQARRAPDGVFPFEAVVIPQGWCSTHIPGRLTAIDVKTKVEYIIHQSTATDPRFYHQVIFVDMDRDGFVVGNSTSQIGELVWFRNPGAAALDPFSPWQETILYGGPKVLFRGPDIALQSYDFEQDGVEEIVATSFFTTSSSVHGKISIFSAPIGGSWTDVDALRGKLPRVVDVVTDQGLPFDVEIVDLNCDGRMDILATNHQSITSSVSGRVLAIEQLETDDLFHEGSWRVHVLMDDIQPMCSTLFGQARCLAPGNAKSFHPQKRCNSTHVFNDVTDKDKPWILVGGDQAGKAWVLQPVSQDPTHWGYIPWKVFDVNDFYNHHLDGSDYLKMESDTKMDRFVTLSTNRTDSFSIVSTIGQVNVHYHRHHHPDDRLAGHFSGNFCHAQLFIPVFEAQSIHVLSLEYAAAERWMGATTTAAAAAG
jgi:hypothetical protein